MRVALLGVLLTGCTLYDSRGDGGDDVGPPPPPGGGPVGRVFAIDRTQTQPSGCFGFSEEDQSHTVDVESVNVVFVDGVTPAGIVVRNAAAREPADPPNVVFSLFESWSGPNGSAGPQIQYEIWVDGNLVTGKARTSFPNPDPAGPPGCSYAWTLSSF